MDHIPPPSAYHYTIDECLYALTWKDLKSGLTGVPTSFCKNSIVDPSKGVFYAGYPISTLAEKSLEEVLFLLDHLQLPNNAELELFKDTLQKTALKKIPAFEIPFFEDPMDMLHIGLLRLGEKIKISSKEEIDPFKRCEKEALLLRAHLPFLIASIINVHAGYSETPAYDPHLNYIENFVQMLKLPDLDKDKFSDLLRLFLILHLAHGSGNLSTSIAAYVASAQTDLFHAMTAGMVALQAPLHGGANRESFFFIKEASLRKDPLSLVDEYLEQKKVIPGFGHRILRCTDPRTLVLNAYAKRHFPNAPLVNTSLLLQESVPIILKIKKPTISNPYPNVDVISATLLDAAGFDPSYSTLLFGWARMIGGITAQVLDERKEKIPLHRPDSIYTGPLLGFSLKTK